MKRTSVVVIASVLAACGGGAPDYTNHYDINGQKITCDTFVSFDGKQSDTNCRDVNGNSVLPPSSTAVPKATAPKMPSPVLFHKE